MSNDPARKAISVIESLESRQLLSVAPPAPGGVDVELIAPRAVRINWTDVEGETGYRVEKRVDGTDGPWSPVVRTAANVTTAVHDGLAFGKTYLFRVIAFTGELESPASSVDTVTTPAAPAVPPAPTGLDATLIAPRAVVLEWTDVVGETGYIVERRVDGTAEWSRAGQTGENVTRFAQDGLPAGKTLFYRVRAVNAGGASDPSNVDSVTVPGEATLPAAPQLAARLVAPRAVRLEWSNVANETGYKIERRVDGSAEPFQQIATTARDVTGYVDDGLDAGKTYVYRVRAANEAGNSAYSNTVAVTTTAEGTAPAAPTELNAELAEEGRAVRLRWNDVAGELGYKIERRFDGPGSGEWVQIGTTGANVTSFLDTRIEPGKVHVYRVRAFNAAGPSPYSNSDSVAVPERPAVPAAPRLEAGVAGPRAVRLAWTNVAGETGYRIERRVDGSEEGFVEIRSVNADVTGIVDDGLTPGTTYVYRVRAFNAAGNGPYSNSAAATPREISVPAAPTELSAELAEEGRAVRLRWNNVAGERGFKIERRLDGTTTWVQVGATPADVTTFLDTRFERGGTYIYRVRAHNEAGSSPWSNTDSVVVPGVEPTVPVVPRLETAVAGARAVRLAWTNVAGETGYRIERKVDGSAEGFREIRTVGANVTSIVDEGLTTGTTYIYRVRAFNSAGNSPYSNTSAATPRLETPRPAAPRELSARAVSPTRIDLRWGNVAGETGFRVERRLEGTDTWVKIGLAPADVTTFSDTKALPGRTYFYRVRSVSLAGSSPWSNVASAKTPEAPVVVTRAGLFSTTRIGVLGLEDA